MAWEPRGNRRFFYRSTRVNGRVVTKYLGKGPAAIAAAAEIAQARKQRQVEQAQLRAMENEDAPLDQLMELLQNRADLLLEASLISRGYRQHRGEWRPA